MSLSSETPLAADSRTEGTARESAEKNVLAAFADLEASIGKTPLLPPRDPLGARLAALMTRHSTVLLALCVGLLWMVIAAPSLWPQRGVQIGQPAPRDIIAPANAFVPNVRETRERRREASELVPPDYEPRPEAQARALNQMHTLVASLKRVAAEVTDERSLAGADSDADFGADADTNAVSPPSRAAAVRRQWLEEIRQINVGLERPLPDSLTPQIENVAPARWQMVENVAASAILAVYGPGSQIRSDVPDDLVAARLRISGAVRQVRQNTKLRDSEADVAAGLAHFVVQPNLVVDDWNTLQKRREAQNEVREVFLRVASGTPVVREGELVTEEKWAQLQEMGLAAPRLDAPGALARLALCVLMIGIVAVYVTLFHGGLLNRPAQLWLTAMVPILFLAVFRALLGTPYAGFLLIPLTAAAAMLLTILIDARIGFLTAFLIAGLGALMARTDVMPFLAATLSGWIGVLSVADIASRGQLLRAAGLLCAVNFVLAGVFGTLQGLTLTDIAPAMGWNGLAGVLSVALAAALVPLLERPFGITTHLRLLELLGPQEAVLRRMQTEAPGTYTHSLMVSTLSEAAAKAVGADSLLCRVGGLYHDIGKLHRPHCFIENQSGDNIHDRLPPQLSAMIIIAHVRDGLELGRALRLPRPVLDIIAQHHGTTLISFFYRQAILRGNPDAAMLEETLFRYPGPRPRMKEAAIVLLADTIEASSRALPQPTPEKLEAHIREMIRLRLEEGELSECDLTLRDLGVIEETFIHVVRGVLHHRIEYPNSRPLQDETDNAWVQATLAENFHEAGAEPTAKAAASVPPIERRGRRDRRATLGAAGNAKANAVGNANGAARKPAATTGRSR